MGQSNRLFPKQVVFWVLLLVLIVTTVLAWASEQWRVTNLVIGFLFGFFLQRGNFCGASILSSVVLYKDFWGLTGVGMALFTSMVGFAGLSALGWIQPNPAEPYLILAVIGGTAFGSGMVLAGGCVSGSLYKAAEGRLNSMLALVGIAIGGTLVSTEIVVPWRVALSMFMADLMLPASIDQWLQVSYSVPAALLGVVGIAVVLVIVHRRKKGGIVSELPSGPLPTRGWSFAFVGIMFGILGWLAYLSYSASGRIYPLAPTRSFLTLSTLLWEEASAARWWRGMEALAIIVGASTSAWLSGQLKLRSADKATLVLSLLGGVLAGGGAVIGGGCFFGNVVSGWALLSFQSFVFVFFMILANWATTIVYIRGLRV
jgi:uncharacterized membrane protein YedE/YeeE